ncbi:MAG: DUF3887 domain-containing protein [Peptoniphilaceae bacterium]
MEKANFKIIVCLIVCVTLLTGCTGSGLSDNFDEEEVREQAKEIITIINNENSEELLEMSTEESREALTKATLEEVYTSINEGGEFNKFEDISVAGHEDESSEEEFAVVVVNSKYENKNFTYTITFDKEMKLAGFYYK